MATCKQCTKCCRHIAIELDKPKSKADFKELIWYVMHKDVLVFVDHDNEWFVEFKTNCKALTKQRRCSIYDQRPDICRDYDPEECEKNGEGSPYKLLFKTKKDIEKYVQQKTKISSLY